MGKGLITLKRIKEFENSLYCNEKSKNTVEKYMRDLRKFAEYAEGKEISKALVLSYKSEIGEHYAVASANSMLASLNSFLKFVGKYDCCVKQFRFQKKIYCSENAELSRREYASLVRAAEKKKNKRLSLIIQTICTTGIRVSELEYVTVEAVNKGEMTVHCKGKIRKVLMVSKLCKRLIAYAEYMKIKSGMIFVTKYGKAMNRSNIWREMKKLCNEAEIEPEKVFPHNLRQSLCKNFLRNRKRYCKACRYLRSHKHQYNQNIYYFKRRRAQTKT